MRHHTGQTSSSISTHSEELNLVVFTQQNRHLTSEILPFGV